MDFEIEITIRTALKQRREFLIAGWLRSWGWNTQDVERRGADLQMWANALMAVNDAYAYVVGLTCPEVLK